MELYQLEELLAFGKHGTISKAAEAIGVSQPAMSRALRLLENDIGVPIFHRTNNTIELTEAGKLAVAYAKEITESISKAVEDIREADRRQKTILVGSEAPAPLWSVISMLSSLDGTKTIAGELKDRKALQEGLDHGTYSYIITMAPVRSRGTMTAKLGEENLMFMLPRSNPLSERKSLRFADMNGENMLLYSNIGAWRGLPERKMPDSKFFIQNDYIAFSELVRKSSIPSFLSDLSYERIEGKAAIPISDKEAHVEYFISAADTRQKNIAYLAKHFLAEFRNRKLTI